MPPRRPSNANANSCDAKPVRRLAWDVYRAAAKARWVGRVEAPTADAAITFNSDAWKLIAVRRREIT